MLQSDELEQLLQRVTSSDPDAPAVALTNAQAGQLISEVLEPSTFGLKRLESLDDYADLLDRIAASLHAANRIWISESHFLWQVTVLLGDLGTTMVSLTDDPDIVAEFGTGWVAGTLTRDEARARLLEILQDRPPPRPE